LDKTKLQKPPAKSSGFARILTAVVVLPFLIASIIVPTLWWLFVALAAAALTFGLFEFYKLAKRRDMKPNIVAMFLGGAAIFTVFLFNEPGQLVDALVILLILVLLTIGTLVAATFEETNFEKMIASAGASILGVLYVALLGSHLVAVRTGFTPRLSRDLLSLFFLVMMGSDIGAYYVGRLTGKHKLAPKISPGKTWEGLVGGILAALAMAALAHFWFFRDLPLKWVLPLAGVMAILGVLGDLTESALKRGAGAKDAASLLPGHGGLLDRLDSLLFNAPLIYYFGRFYLPG
jgi:phosphatidate cytidylyltransferase